MSEFPGDYLWDRSGDADEALRRLEMLLARYRHIPPLRIPPDQLQDTPPEDDGGE